jgi:hypothetical protein
MSDPAGGRNFQLRSRIPELLEFIGSMAFLRPLDAKNLVQVALWFWYDRERLSDRLRRNA